MLRKVNWPLIACVLFCVLFWLAVGVGIARAANYGDPRLDVVATAVAGHPVQVSCSANSHDWALTEDQGHLTVEADGFTFVGGQPVIYLAPRICDTLEALENGAPAVQVGPYWASLAIKTILHESTHQSGVTDERTTDCQALALMPSWLPKFGIPAKVSQVSYVRISGTQRYKRVVKTVTNPLYAQTLSWASRWHNAVPVFGGPC